MKETIFFRQADLILDILPLLRNDRRFALKGGTALNFFIREMPRLSIDIDLAYLPIEDRDTTLNNIDRALIELREQIQLKIPMARINPKQLREDNRVFGLIVTRENATVKIEPNRVTRSSVYPIEDKYLVKKAQDFFEKAVQVQSLSLEDLYGSKICAALDRQHPRDLFDIKLLFDHEGYTNKIHQAFIVYLISHNRPILDLLNPNIIDITQVYETEFRGITFDPVTLGELNTTRKTLIHIVKAALTEKDRRFLVSIKTGNPDWTLFELDHIRRLPAVQWKLMNIQNMPRHKNNHALKRLRNFLEI